MCEQILTISKARLLGSAAVGKLSGDEIRKVEAAVKLSLALPSPYVPRIAMTAETPACSRSISHIFIVGAFEVMWPFRALE